MSNNEKKPETEVSIVTNRIKTELVIYEFDVVINKEKIKIDVYQLNTKFHDYKGTNPEDEKFLEGLSQKEKETVEATLRNY